MIGSLFKDLPPLSETETEPASVPEDVSSGTDSDNSLLAALPVVQKIVRRKTVSSWREDAADLIQNIALRLLKWRSRYSQKSEEMSAEEWKSFAAQTAYNEINRHFSKNRTTDLPIEAAADIASGEQVEGQSEIEVSSLTRQVWQEICSLTLRQRRSLLLHTELLQFHLQFDGITDEEIAGGLEISEKEWDELQELIPLSYRQIAELFFEQESGQSLESLAKSFKKAKHEASVKVRRVTEK